MSPTNDSQKSAKSTTATGKKSEGFTDEERAAMKERAQELKAAARADKDKAEGESDVLAKIAEMQEPDRAMAERLHALIKASAPVLSPKTWYGMPAYAKDGKVVCFFQSAHKFKTRYATFGFEHEANLDEGAMWPVAFAVTKLTASDEAKIAEMPEPERSMAMRLHTIIKASAPALTPKTWYGMPAYARDGKVVCFFQSAHKFKTRYATFGFSDAANLDDGALWPTAFALKELTAAAEAKIAALVKKAVR